MKDLPYYCEKYLTIRDKDGAARPLKFNFAQRFVHDKLTKQWKAKGYVKAIILKARQEGVSTYVAARFFRRAHLWPMQRVQVIANQRANAVNIFEFYTRYQNWLPDNMRIAQDGYHRGMFLALQNESQVVVDTANNAEAGKGSTVQRLHASELAFWEKAEDTLVNLKQTIPDSGSEEIYESTANGVGNVFHVTWEEAVAGQNDFIAIFLPWWIHEEYTHKPKRISKELRAEILDSQDEFERRALDVGIEWEGETHKLTVERLSWRRWAIKNKCQGSELVFRQEYPSTAREAFIVSGSCWFDTDALVRYEENTQLPEERGNFVDYKLLPNATGYVKVWLSPTTLFCRHCGDVAKHIEQKGPDKHCADCGRVVHEGVYVVGADTAEGKQVAAMPTTFSDPEAERGGRDFNSADVIEAYTRKQVAHIHGRMKPDVFAQQLNMLGYFYSSRGSGGKLPALMGIEKNHSSGETVLKALKHVHNYPNLFYSRTVNRRSERPTPVMGWVTTKETRPIMLDELEQAIREQTLEIPCAETIKECFTFVRGEDGKPEAQEGCHDDRVMSLAITNQLAQRAAFAGSENRRVPEVAVADSPTGWGF